MLAHKAHQQAMSSFQARQVARAASPQRAGSVRVRTTGSAGASAGACSPTSSRICCSNRANSRSSALCMPRIPFAQPRFESGAATGPTTLLTAEVSSAAQHDTGEVLLLRLRTEAPCVQRTRSWGTMSANRTLSLAPCARRVGGCCTADDGSAGASSDPARVWPDVASCSAAAVSLVPCKKTACAMLRSVFNDNVSLSARSPTGKVCRACQAPARTRRAYVPAIGLSHVFMGPTPPHGDDCRLIAL